MARTVGLNLPMVFTPAVQRLFFPAAAIVLSLSFWSAFVALHVIPENLLPGPIATLQAGLQQARMAIYGKHGYEPGAFVHWICHWGNYWRNAGRGDGT